MDNNNNNNNTEGFEVALEEAPPSADDIEQLPIANDNDYDEHVVVNYHATKKYIVGAFAVGIVAFAAFFGIGMGSGHGISELVFSNRNKSAASSSISSASNMAFTTHKGGGAKAAKVAKSSKSKSGKSEVGQVIVTSGTGLPVAIPIGIDGVAVTLPVELEEGCGCTVANVAITIGINHPNVGDLEMALFSPRDAVPRNAVFLVFRPSPSDANLVAGNKITFDGNAGAPGVELGDIVDSSGNIAAGTYNAVGDLGKFNGKTAAGDWIFGVDDFSSGDTGTIQSVELTITCE